MTLVYALLIRASLSARLAVHLLRLLCPTPQLARASLSTLGGGMKSRSSVDTKWYKGGKWSNFWESVCVWSRTRESGRWFVGEAEREERRRAVSEIEAWCHFFSQSPLPKIPLGHLDSPGIITEKEHYITYMVSSGKILQHSRLNRFRNNLHNININ